MMKNICNLIHLRENKNAELARTKWHVLLTVLFMLFKNGAISIKLANKKMLFVLLWLGVRFRLGCYYAIIAILLLE